MSLISNNIKFLRTKFGLTQQAFADKVGIKRPAVGAYEEERAEPKIATLREMAVIFSIDISWLINKDLSKISNTDWENRGNIDAAGSNLRVLSITVDEGDNENVELVSQKASAGYTNGFSDPEYVQELPRLYLPMLKEGTHRAFEISGDSMLPLQSGSVVVGGFVDNWNEIKDGKTYVVITQSEGVVYKRVFNRIFEKGSLLLKSDNTQYSEYEVSIEDIKEVWEACWFITNEIPSPSVETIAPSQVNDLASALTKLQQEVENLKGKIE